MKIVHTYVLKVLDFLPKQNLNSIDLQGQILLGMTLVPECQLAREAQICYASISTVTDYDVWAEKPVTAKEVLSTLSKNVERTKKVLTELIEKIPKTRNCNCEKALEEAEF